jgi:hypothetical protein
VIAVAFIDPFGDLQADGFVRWISGETYVVLGGYVTNIIVGDEVEPQRSGYDRTDRRHTPILGAIDRCDALQAICLASWSSRPTVTPRYSTLIHPQRWK